MSHLTDNVLFRNGHTMGLVMLVKNRIERNFPDITPAEKALMYQELATVLRQRSQRLRDGKVESV